MISKKIKHQALLLGAVGLTACNPIQETAKENKTEKPNIIVIMCDDMGYSDIGCFGGEINTPNLDQMAREGIRFTQFCNTAKCFSSRASLLTGMYAYEVHSGTHWHDPMDDCMTIAEVLKTKGYHTMFSGKWHLHDKPYERGFDNNYGFYDLGIINSYFHPMIEGPVLPWRNTPSKSPKWIAGDTIMDTYEPENPNFYATDAFTTKAMEWMDEQKDNKNPFFLYLAYNAPHWPLQAPDEDIKKYVGKYLKGWDKIREERTKKMKKLGIINKDLELSPRDNDVPAWEDIENKVFQDSLMAVYAAMIDRMDQNIGKLRQKLEKLGIADNTLILFFSDNGGDKLPLHQNPGVPVGSPYSFDAYGRGWANVSNTPFRGFKGQAHEGGIASPLIAWWPDGIKFPSRISHQQSHLVDVMATCIESSGATYPSSYNGKTVRPLQGKSLYPVFINEQADQHEYTFFSRPGGQAVKKGNWKLVRTRNSEWELYNIENDRVELINKISENKQKADELKNDYKSWGAYSKTTQWDKWLANRTNIIPVKALDVVMEQTNNNKFRLVLSNTLHHEMHFAGTFQSNQAKIIPAVVNETIPPGKKKIIEIKVENHENKLKEIQLEWTNTFINEYIINKGQTFTESGLEKITLK